MLTFLLGAAAGYVLAQGTTRTTILNWLLKEKPVVEAEAATVVVAAVKTEA